MQRLRIGQFIRSLTGVLRGRVNIPTTMADNPVLGVLLRRRSTRKFTDQDLSADVIDTILEAGRLAPAGVNLPTWTFGVYDRAQWRDVFNRPIPFGGVLAIIVFGDMHRVRLAISEFPHKPLTEFTLAMVNAGIAAYAMNVAAEACGVASVMLSETGKTGFYDAHYLRETLQLPEGVFPVTTIVFGYAAGGLHPLPPKLPAAEVAYRGGRYRRPDPEVMRAWAEQMQAGYRAMYVTRSFNDQLRAYNSRIDATEQGLRDMVYYRDEEFHEPQ